MLRTIALDEPKCLLSRAEIRPCRALSRTENTWVPGGEFRHGVEPCTTKLAVCQQLHCKVLSHLSSIFFSHYRADVETNLSARTEPHEEPIETSNAVRSFYFMYHVHSQ
jgi:hypothetical protein